MFTGPDRCLLVVLAGVVLAGCGSAPAKHVSGVQARRVTAGEQLVVAAREQKVKAEASDMNETMTCREWLSDSAAARGLYLDKEWPHLSRKQVDVVVREQTLGCEASPGPASRPRTPMAPLQAAVDLVAIKAARFYIVAAEEGVKENVAAYDAKFFGSLGLARSRPQPPSRHRSSKPPQNR